MIAGGEYGVSSTDGVDAAIYDPVLDTWTIIPAPYYCTNMRDTQSIVLADGRWMKGFAWRSGGAFLDSKTLTWKQLKYNGQFERND